MKKAIVLSMAVFILSLVSCTDKKDEKLTVKDIEIFKDEYLRFNAMFYSQKNQANNFKTSKNN